MALLPQDLATPSCQAAEVACSHLEHEVADLKQRLRFAQDQAPCKGDARGSEVSWVGWVFYWHLWFGGLQLLSPTKL